MAQGIQIAAGALVVGAFAGLQYKVLSPYRFAYLALNFAGTAVLTVFAVIEAQYGFILTNGVWAAVSLVGLLRLGQLHHRAGQGDER